MRRYLLGDIRYIIVNPAPKVNIRTKHTAHGAGISAVSALFPGGFFCYTGKTDRGPDGPAEANVNVEEVTQRILRGTFAMIMLVDVSSCSMDFTAFAEKMKQKGDELGVDVRCTRQEIYDAMHRI